jgi:hypothetical protein
MLDDPTLYNRSRWESSGRPDSLVISLNSSKGTAGLLLRDTTLYRNMLGITRGADSLMRTLTNGQGTASKLLTDPDPVRSAQQARDRSERHPGRRAPRSEALHEGDDQGILTR